MTVGQASTVSRLLALTRPVSPAIVRCELTHASRVPIDVAAAAAQHDEYERTLAALGCTITRLPVEPEMPDSVFIEDTAVVLDDIAIIMRPGAESRRREVPRVEETLKHHRLLAHIEPPGTMDGGDVLVAGKTVFVGVSTRTNAEGIDQLTRIVEYFGYAVREVPVAGCLHLKSAVTAASDTVLIVDRQLVSADVFDGFDLIGVDPAERGAANVLRVNDDLVVAAGYPRTRDRLEMRGFSVLAVELGEIAKAEGAVTCCSLILKE
jgi:dimethylargininase